MFTIYLDVCCLNRPYDDQRQDRVRLESEAVRVILSRVVSGRWAWASSDMVRREIEQIPDARRRGRVRLQTQSATVTIEMGDSELARGKILSAMGFGSADALHLACAEAGGVDIFLTTDDRLQRLATRRSGDLHVRVANPRSWLSEIGAQ